MRSFCCVSDAILLLVLTRPSDANGNCEIARLIALHACGWMRETGKNMWRNVPCASQEGQKRWAHRFEAARLYGREGASGILGSELPGGGASAHQLIAHYTYSFLLNFSSIPGITVLCYGYKGIFGAPIQVIPTSVLLEVLQPLKSSPFHPIPQ